MYFELTKFRLSGLVVITAAIGYLMGQPDAANLAEAALAIGGALLSGEWSRAGEYFAVSFGAVDWLAFLFVLLGTGLAAGGTSAINQWMEIDRDGAMPRTADRPLPSRAMSRNEAFFAGVVMIALGVGVLELFVNSLASFLALFTAAVYILVYTPLKVRSTLNTLVGAVCGAVPPMIGWAAAAESLALGAWILAGVLFIWQLPHFLALAWMYRDDYARGGFRMLPIHDQSGELTGRVVVLTSLLLIPLSLMATLAGISGMVFATVALGLGLWFAASAVQLYRRRTHASARTVFLTSIIYLPLLLGAMLLDQPRPPVRAMAFETTLAQAETSGLHLLSPSLRGTGAPPGEDSGAGVSRVESGAGVPELGGAGVPSAIDGEAQGRSRR